MDRLTRAAVSLAVAVVPLAPLYCPSDDPAAMSCCTDRSNTCNQPTAPDDDCCRDAPTDGQTLSASGALRVDLEPAAALQAVPQVRVVATAGAWTSHRPWRLGPTYSAPRPPLILRI